MAITKGVNHQIIQGKIIFSDPELKTHFSYDNESQWDSCNFTVETFDPYGEIYVGNDGKEYKRTNKYNIVAHGDIANEIIENYKKGDTITLICRNHTKTGINNEGKAYSNVQYNVNYLDRDNVIGEQFNNLVKDFISNKISQLYDMKSEQERDNNRDFTNDRKILNNRNQNNNQQRQKENDYKMEL